ncbi:MAG: molybdopterin oxidoreductase, partial [Proteobacteria bacterium]|nr:molybdopterin oxidoreductase [Pseudomonadota bacterium]
PEIFQQQLSTMQNNYPDLTGITFNDIKKKGFVSVPIQYRKFEETGFMTGSGKVELASGYLESLGYDPLPYYEEPPESPLSTPELAPEYPLVLTTGGRLKYFFCSEFRQVPTLRRKHPDPLVEIHPETAEKYGITEGDWVWIETRRGQIQQKAKLTDGIDPRVINVQYGWWFPENPAPEYGVWKSNANVLTSNAAPYDPAMGTYQLRALLCKIRKVETEASSELKA